MAWPSAQPKPFVYLDTIQNEQRGGVEDVKPKLSIQIPNAIPLEKPLIQSHSFIRTNEEKERIFEKLLAPFSSYDLAHLHYSLLNPPILTGNHRHWDICDTEKAKETLKEIITNDIDIEDLIVKDMPLPFLFLKIQSHYYTNNHFLVWKKENLWYALYFHVTRCSSGGCNNEGIEWYVGKDVEELTNLFGKGSLLWDFEYKERDSKQKKLYQELASLLIFFA
jgi:hypothetical protein